jgi:hypothetical protein
VDPLIEELTAASQIRVSPPLSFISRSPAVAIDAANKEEWA